MRDIRPDLVSVVLVCGVLVLFIGCCQDCGGSKSDFGHQLCDNCYKEYADYGEEERRSTKCICPREFPENYSVMLKFIDQNGKAREYLYSLEFWPSAVGRAREPDVLYSVHVDGEVLYAFIRPDAARLGPSGTIKVVTIEGPSEYFINEKIRVKEVPFDITLEGEAYERRAEWKIWRARYHECRAGRRHDWQFPEGVGRRYYDGVRGEIITSRSVMEYPIILN